MQLKDKLIYSQKDDSKATWSVLELLNSVLEKNIQVEVRNLHKVENEQF